MTAWADAPLLDGNAQRAQLAGQALLLLAAWVFGWWPLIAIAALVMAIGALWWPAGALFIRAHQQFVVPRLPAVTPIDARPPRFSAAAGTLTLAGMAALIAAGAHTIGWGFVLVTATALIAEVVVGRCGPCELFVWGARHGIVQLARPLVGR